MISGNAEQQGTDDHHGRKGNMKSLPFKVSPGRYQWLGMMLIHIHNLPGLRSLIQDISRCQSPCARFNDTETLGSISNRTTRTVEALSEDIFFFFSHAAGFIFWRCAFYEGFGNGSRSACGFARLGINPDKHNSLRYGK